MTYNDVVKVQRSDGLLNRVVACAAVEGQEDPDSSVRQAWWKFAAQPGWASKWASKEARLTDEEKASYVDIGSLDDVITDDDIRSAVQVIFPSSE